MKPTKNHIYYPAYLKVLEANPGQWFTDNELADKLGAYRKAIARMRDLSIEKGHGYFVKVGGHQLGSDGKRKSLPIAYQLTSEHVGYRPVPDKAKPVDISVLRQIEISCNAPKTAALATALIQLNTGHWEMKQLAALLSCSTAEAQHRFYSFLAPRRNRIEVHIRVGAGGSSKLRKYLIVESSLPARTASSTGSTKKKSVTKGLGVNRSELLSVFC